jgi:hypothetical protein
VLFPHDCADSPNYFVAALAKKQPSEKLTRSQRDRSFKACGGHQHVAWHVAQRSTLSATTHLPRPPRPLLPLRLLKRVQVIANGRRIGDIARWAPPTAASCAFRASISVASSIDGNSSARFATIEEMVWASSGVSRPEPTSSAVPAGDHLQHGGSPHDEVEPCDRKVGKEYKTEKPKGEGERRDDICRGAF